MPSCSVAGCGYRPSKREATAQNIKYQCFPLPKEPPELRQLWTRYLIRDNYVLTGQQPVVCERHFQEEAYEEINLTTRGNPKRKRKLKPSSYPTLFLHPAKVAKKIQNATSVPEIERPRNVIEILFDKRKNKAPPDEQQAAEVAALEAIHNENPDQQVDTAQDHTYQKKVC